MQMLIDKQDSLLADFINVQNARITSIAHYLRKRNFIEGKEVARIFLEEAWQFLPLYSELTDYDLKENFLRSLSNAWEVADSANIFNQRNLPHAFKNILDFSRRRFDEICDINSQFINKTEISDVRQSGSFWEEIIRCSLIFIGEEYRLQRDLESCQEHLKQLFTFIEQYLGKFDNYSPNFILAQCHYYSAKIARFLGDLAKSDTDLLTACRVFRNEAYRLSKEQTTFSTERLREIQLRSGVLEVSHAWFYFSQGRYSSAIHTATNALIMLAGSKDRITQLHAELVIYAAKRALAIDIGDLLIAIKELERLRNKFNQYDHFRLRVKADYEYVLALIILDALLEEYPKSSISSEFKDPLARASKILIKYKKKDKVSVRWRSLLYTLESRYLRRKELKKVISSRDFREALKNAREAYIKANKINNIFCLVEALISRGEIYFQMYVTEKFNKSVPSVFLEEALNSFREANKLCEYLCKEGGFPDLQGVVKLYLARIYIYRNDFELVGYYLKEFNNLKNTEHGRLKRLEKMVLAESDRTNTNVLEINTANFYDMVEELKPLLISKAEEMFRSEKKPSEEKLSEAIGITRVTLKKWRDHSDKKNV